MRCVGRGWSVSGPREPTETKLCTQVFHAPFSLRGVLLPDRFTVLLFAEVGGPTLVTRVVPLPAQTHSGPGILLGVAGSTSRLQEPRADPLSSLYVGRPPGAGSVGSPQTPALEGRAGQLGGGGFWILGDRHLRRLHSGVPTAWSPVAAPVPSQRGEGNVSAWQLAF